MLNVVTMRFAYCLVIVFILQCSVSCGEKSGTQYRDVECVLVRPGQQRVVDENNCAHTPKPAVMKECSVLPCTSWRHGSWGRVSVTNVLYVSVCFKLVC